MRFYAKELLTSAAILSTLVFDDDPFAMTFGSRAAIAIFGCDAGRDGAWYHALSLTCGGDAWP
jgi:hypothetical protein